MLRKGRDRIKQEIEQELASDNRLNTGLSVALAAGIFSILGVLLVSSSETRAFLAAMFFVALLAQAVVGVLSRRLILPFVGGLMSLVVARGLFAMGLRTPNVSLMLYIAITYMLTAVVLGAAIGRSYVAVRDRLQPQPQREKRVVAFVPALGAAGQNPEFMRRYQEATLAQSQGRVEDAVKDYQDALRMEPGVGIVHASLGVLLAELGRADDAIAEFGAAVKHNPGDAGAWFRLGMLLAGRHRHKEAVAAYESFMVQGGAENAAYAQFARKRIDDLKRLIAAEPGS